MQKIKVKGQGHRGKIKSAPISGQLLQFLIHRWLRNDAQSLKWFWKASLVFKVFCQISKSHGKERATKSTILTELSVSEL